VVAAAIHAGHDLRPDVERLMALDEADRLREEDPFTGGWTDIAPTAVVVNRSRFEVDVNRSRERAVYRAPEDAWGLRLWHEPLPQELVEESLAAYDRFYRMVGELLDGLCERHRRFLVLDLHSYCHRRGGPAALADDPLANPEINIGTGSLDEVAFGRIAERFVEGLERFDFGDGRSLDVRENVRFEGGHFSAWINSRYSGVGCALAIEVKKFFMDEWSGQLDQPVFDRLDRALVAATRTAVAELERE
jgi:N-formylglutamate amidohydrolase